jgi:hypothetical protein
VPRPLAFLSLPGLTQCCPVNLSFTSGCYGPARRSMRSWESLRRGANWRREFPRSHGPNEGRVDGKRVNLRLMPLMRRFPAGGRRDVGSRPAHGTLNRAALGLIRQSTPEPAPVLRVDAHPRGGANWRRGFPRSHGSNEGRVDRKPSVNGFDAPGSGRGRRDVGIRPAHGHAEPDSIGPDPAIHSGAAPVLRVDAHPRVPNWAWYPERQPEDRA